MQGVYGLSGNAWAIMLVKTAVELIASSYGIAFLIGAVTYVVMREGVPKDGKEREMMSPVARSRFSHFTDEEVNALYAFLAGKGPGAN